MRRYLALIALTALQFTPIAALADRITGRP